MDALNVRLGSPGCPRYAWSGIACTAAPDAASRAVSPPQLMEDASRMSPTTEALSTFEEEMKSRLEAIETKLDKIVLVVARAGDNFRGHDLTGDRCSQCSSPLKKAEARANGAVDDAIVCLPSSIKNDGDSPSCQKIDSASSIVTPIRSRRRTLRKTKMRAFSENLPSVDLKHQATWIREQVNRPGQSVVQRLSQRVGVMVGPGTQVLETAQNRPLWRFVQSNKFQIVASTMIVLNVVFIGVLTHVQLQNIKNGQPRHIVWTVIELLFSAYFLIEIMIRLAAERFLFLFGPFWQWNLLDTVLVCLSITDVTVNFSKPSATKNFNAARVLRFARFLRLISLARAMRAFQQLRMVVFTIFESISSLFWCFFILVVILFTFAVFLVQAVAEHINVEPTANSHAAVLELYGGILTAMNTLFMTISGGIDWKDAMIPLADIHWAYNLLFSLYIFFMVIGVLNVVIGAFVTRTGEIASRDREYLVKSQLHELNTYFHKVRTFFKEADKDKSGMLSIEEFRETLTHPDVQAYFNALDLDVTQAELLFTLLDQDRNDGVISLDEFLAGCMRLRGQAKSIDVNILLHANRRLFNRITELMEAVAEAFDLDSGCPKSRTVSLKQTALPSAFITVQKRDDPNEPGQHSGTATA